MTRRGGRYILGRALAVLVAVLLAGPAEARCRLALALGLDISSSVDDREYALQIGGLADALESAEVIEAILTPEGTHIVAAAYEWSGYPQQDVIVGWTVLDSEGAIRGFAARLRAHPRPYWDFATALGKGVEFGARLLGAAPSCARQVIDISGDGVNNVGVDPTYFYASGLFAGITVNGLVIQGAQPDPVEYYRTNVIHGPGAFLAVARDFEDYRQVIKRKLLREIASDLVLGER